MTAAVITASASVVVAVLVFVLNQLAQVRRDRREAALSRVNGQLRELYGPLFALVAVNETIWETLRSSQLPGKAARRSGDPSERSLADWREWLGGALMPANAKMRDLIFAHADLLIEDSIPEPVQVFCAHVAAYEVLIGHDDSADPIRRRTLVQHPGAPFVDYVRESFANLKQRQARLLAAKPLSRGGVPPSVA